MVERPADDISRLFTDLGAVVVQEIAKLNKAAKNYASYDADRKLVSVFVPGEVDKHFYLDPQIIRQNDTSARSIEELTSTRKSHFSTHLSHFYT